MEFDINRSQFVIDFDLHRIQKKRSPLWIEQANLKADIRELDKKLKPNFFPEGYVRGDKKKWRAERKALVEKLGKVETELKNLTKRRKELSKAEIELNRWREKFAAKRQQFVAKYPEHISTPHEHEFVARNVVNGHLNAESWASQVSLLVTMPDGTVLTIRPDYVARIKGKLVVIDAKFSEKKVLSSKPAKIMDTCTDNQTPTYPIISKGRAKQITVENPGSGSLKLKQGEDIQVSPEVLFITNGAQPGTMDIIPLRNGTAGSPITGISAGKKK